MSRLLGHHLFLWALLALPALAMLLGLAAGRTDAMELLHPSGETSARLMIVAIAISPLISVFGPRAWLVWLAARRRHIGVAAFLYALLHLVFYVIDMGNVADMLAEALAPGIWTGWAAFAAMLVPAAISNDASMRALKAGWKRLQRLVYPAAVLTLLHWIWVHNNLGPALVHFVPLALIVAVRAFKSLPRAKQGV
jgi:methionine sulfoxide reductase heme-binding subunit